MTQVQQVRQMIDTLEEAKVKLGAVQDRQRQAYLAYISANGELWHAQQAYTHARGQLEALAVQGLRTAAPPAPESLAGLQRREAFSVPAIGTPAPVAGLSDQDIAGLRNAEAEDLAAEQADEEAAAQPADPVPLSNVTIARVLDGARESGELVLDLSAALRAHEGQIAAIVADVVEARVVGVDAAGDDQAEAEAEVEAAADAAPEEAPAPATVPALIPRAPETPEQFAAAKAAELQAQRQALDIEQRMAPPPRIYKKAKPFEPLSPVFVDRVWKLLTQDDKPVPLATIAQTLKGLYTVETTKLYLREMVHSGHVQRVGTGHYALATWRPAASAA